MLTCIDCQTPVQKTLTFTDLLLLRTGKEVCCSACLSVFDRIGKQVCPRCSRPDFETTCPDCLGWEARGTTVSHLSLYRYNSGMKEFFRRYKFQGDYALRFIFADMLREALKPYLKDYQLVPIPLGSQRFSERGFNQVTGLLEAAGIEYSDILGKIETESQSSKKREERLKQDQPFFIKEGAVLSSKLLLVDDVYTTGTTLHLARQCLAGKNSCEIRTFSLAR